MDTSSSRVSSTARAHLYSDLATDAEMLELVELFVSELPARVEALHAALGASDLPALATLAHQLKGAGGGYGFTPISERAAVLERRAKGHAGAEPLAAAAAELIDLCRRATSSPPPTE